MNETTRCFSRTLVDAFPDATWRSGIEHYRRPSHGFGMWRLFGLVVLCLLVAGAFVK